MSVKITKALQYTVSETKSYSGYKRILMNKMSALLGIDGTVLFDGVYGVAETQPVGNPSCFVMERTGTGQILDTHRNEREWQFSIVIHEKVGQKTPETAYAALLDAVDRVIKSFDQDPMLADVHGQARCKWTRVVPLSYEYASEDTPVHRALLTVAVVDMVNRYA